VLRVRRSLLSVRTRIFIYLDMTCSIYVCCYRLWIFGMSKINKNEVTILIKYNLPVSSKYEGWNFNSGNYLFTTDTK